MSSSTVLAMGAMGQWGAVRIGVMSASDEHGAEHARLRVMSGQGSTTVTVPLGESVTVDGVGTVTLHDLTLSPAPEGDGPPPSGGGGLEVSFDPIVDGAEQ